jgi:hypothetical protein
MISPLVKCVKAQAGRASIGFSMGDAAFGSASVILFRTGV